MSTLNSIEDKTRENTLLIFRAVLFLTHFGHGLVSLGMSAGGYKQHLQLFESINYFNWNAETFLLAQGCLDIFLAFAILLGIFPRVVLPLALTYLSLVTGAAYLFYHSKTGSWFGFAEIGRRLPWIFYALFLLLVTLRGELKFSLLRIGISFGFLSHGITSIGYFGGRGGQIALAAQVFPEETAKAIIFYSGFTDVAIGLLLFSGVFSRLAAAIGCFWLIAVVALSFMTGIPEGIFRSAFFVSCLYVALDARCHFPIWNGAGLGKNNQNRF